MPTTRYNSAAMALHWLTAIIIIAFLIFGENMVESSHGGTAFTRTIHVTLGSLVLLLTLARIGLHMVVHPPAHPPGMKHWEVKLSRLAHAGLYALMVALPLSGWFAASEAAAEDGLAFTYPGGVSLPLPPYSDITEWLGEGHEIASKLMIVLLALHVLAALKHQFIDRDNILARIVPGMR
ncbi:MAG: cytochrome b/b6 domain-containing protein [Aestuariivirgaceae bacterium]|nr:cytochrome b/b6 domain-containing protein [Aestuariivirgaceae bacterium]